VLLPTAVVVTENVPVEEPALTVAGEVTVADALLLDTVTLMLLGALPLSVMVQVDPVGGVTLLGLHESPVSVGVGGNRVTVAVFDTPLNVAVMVTGVLLPTAVVVTENVPVEEPAFTVAGEVTVAEALLLDTVTLMLLGALPLSVMVQVDPVGGVTLVGLHARFVSVGNTGWLMVTVALPPLAEMPFPLPSDALAPLMLTNVEVSVVVEEIWKVTVASEPSVMAVLLRPAMTHRTSPADGLLQLTCLLAADAAPPVVQNVPEAGLRSAAL